MNKNVVKGNVKSLKGQIKQQWAKLTDNDLTAIEGNIEELGGRLQKAYGYTQEKAKQEYDSFMEKHRSEDPIKNPS